MDQTQAPILNALQQIERNKVHGFGAPGHHQGAAVARDLAKALGKRVFEADVITPKGLDDRTEGAHKAERAHALAVGLNAQIVPVMIDDAFDIEHGVAPEALTAALDQHPDAKAFVVVSPTYFGVTSDIAVLSDICHARGLPLICDAAWGGAFAFCEGLPDDALTKGADIAVYSVHKTMGALTQGSALLARGELVDRQRLWMAYELFETTSPSVPILASLDVARREHAFHGEAIWGAVLTRAGELRRKLGKIKGVRVLGHGDLPAGADLDETKVLIDVAALGASGYAIDDWLNEEYRVSVGLSDARHLLAIVSPGTTASDVRALARGLAACAKGLRKSTLSLAPAPDAPPVSALGVEMAMDAGAALFGTVEQVPLASAEGRIAAETIAPAPPGVPRLVPGQRISAAHVAWLTANRDAGSFFLDPIDPTERTVRVVKTTAAEQGIAAA